MWEPSQENEDPSKWPEQKVYTPFSQRNNTFVKNWQDKGLWAEVVNGEEITRKIRVSLTKFVCTHFSAPNSVSGDKDAFYPVSTGGYLSHGSFTSCFQEEKGGSECPFCTCYFLSAFNEK